MVISGLSGNEIFCLNKKGFVPGNLIIGNSVYSLGFVGSLGSSLKTMVGGEVTQLTSLIAEGREQALGRLLAESQKEQDIGITGVSSEIIFHPENIEFLSVGSSLKLANSSTSISSFSSSADGQELYCQIDAGYMPIKFVFGNVAYSIGVSKGIMGTLKTLGRGEIKEYTEIFTTTRNLALERIINEAKEAKANAVVGINTTILPISGMQEMLMIGTASYNKNLPSDFANNPATSDLTEEELWNITSLGYIPLKLMLGTSVYSLGLKGSITSMFKSLVRGEIPELTTLIYEAREKSIGKIMDEAQSIGADDVIGVKTYVYSLGGSLIEFLAIGTAIKKVGGNIKTETPQLLTQAIIRDKDTYTNAAEYSFGVNLNTSS